MVGCALRENGIGVMVRVDRDKVINHCTLLH